MAQCEVCGNDYYLSFEVVTAGHRHVFDCFECAIHKLAPVCAHCGCKIIGHGIEAKETFFCRGQSQKSDSLRGRENNGRALPAEVRPRNAEDNFRAIRWCLRRDDWSVRLKLKCRVS